MDQRILPNDQSYLAETLGDALRAGLTELVLKNPGDPIDYLAKFLKALDKCKPK